MSGFILINKMPGEGYPRVKTTGMNVTKSEKISQNGYFLSKNDVKNTVV